MSGKKCRISDLCLKIQSGGTPSTKNARYYGGNIPWLKTKEVNFNKIYFTENYITEEGLANSSAKWVPEGSVIIAMYGNGDTAGRCAINMIPVTTNQACCNLTFDPKLADNFFMYYLISNHYKDFVNLKNGGAQLNLNAQMIKTFEVQIPPLSAQKRIASILSAYDDLIENNLKRIKLLEEAAQNIYREWFVNFRVNGEQLEVKSETGLPEGWTRTNLYDFAEIQMGFPFRAEEFNENGTGSPVIRIRDIPAQWSNTFSTQSVDDIFLIERGDILVGMDGFFYTDFWCGQRGYLVQRVCRIRSKDPAMHAFLLESLRGPIKYFEKTITGATVAHLGAKHLKTIEIPVPPERTKAALSIFNSLMQQKLNLHKQNQLLKDARDLLLPRLMDGSIEV